MDPVNFWGMIIYIYYIDLYNYDEILYALVNLILLLGFGNAEDHLTNNLNGILGYLSIFNYYFSFFSNYYLEVFCMLGTILTPCLGKNLFIYCQLPSSFRIPI